jgi:hypothetical protein
LRNRNVATISPTARNRSQTDRSRTSAQHDRDDRGQRELAAEATSEARRRHLGQAADTEGEAATMAMKISTLSKDQSMMPSPLVRARDGAVTVSSAAVTAVRASASAIQSAISARAFGQRGDLGQRGVQVAGRDGGLHPRQDRVGIVAFARRDGPTADLPLNEGGQADRRAIARRFPEATGRAARAAAGKAS